MLLVPGPMLFVVAEHDEEIDMNADKPIGSVVSADDGIMPIPPTGMNDDDVLLVSRLRQTNVGEASAKMVGVIHSRKPGIGLAVVEHVLQPVTRGHRRGNGPIVDKTRGAGVDWKAPICPVITHFDRAG